jgi:hypothetical protein
VTEEDLWDHFIKTLEEMIDAQDDMWQEEQYENVHARRKIMEERFLPAKDELKKSLDSYIDVRVIGLLASKGML